MEKIALVLEGGALRGIFTAGVVDCFIDNNIEFDYVVGVSAGACNTLSYVAKQKEFFKDCVTLSSPEEKFYGVRQMATSHKLFDLEKLFHDYADKFNFNFDNFMNSKIKWEMVTTNIETGKPEYMSSNELEKVKLIGMASCSLPLVTKPVKIDGNLYLDGGIADSIPLKHALDLGYKKVVVVATRRKGSYSKIGEAQRPLYNRMYKKYPNLINTAFKRTRMYRREVDLCEKMEKTGDVILIRPSFLEVSRLESNIDELNLAYYHGYVKASEYIEQIKKW